MPNNFEKKRTMKGWQAYQEIFKSIIHKICKFFLLSNRSGKQRLYIFSVILSKKNKQWLYKIQKCLTSLSYHVLLIKQNEYLVWNSEVSLHFWRIWPTVRQSDGELKNKSEKPFRLKGCTKNIKIDRKAAVLKVI